MEIYKQEDQLFSEEELAEMKKEDDQVEFLKNQLFELFQSGLATIVFKVLDDTIANRYNMLLTSKDPYEIVRLQGSMQALNEVRNFMLGRYQEIKQEKEEKNG